MKPYPRQFQMGKLGWLLLAGFVGVLGIQSDIASNVRLFQVAYLVGFAGYGLLVWRALSGVERENGGGGFTCLLGCVMLRLALLGFAPSDDVSRYLWEGRVQNAGFNPFVVAPDDERLADLRDANWHSINHPDYPAIYPPLAQWFFRAVAFIAPTPQTFKVAFLWLDVLVLLVLYAWLQAAGMPRERIVLYGACPLTLVAMAGEGHLDSLMLLAMAGAGLAYARGRYTAMGVCVGAAILAKSVPVILLPWLIVRSRRAAAAAIATVVIGYLPFADAGWGLTHSLWRFTQTSELMGLLYSVASSVVDGRSARWLGASLAVGIIAWHARRESDFAEHARVAFAVTLLCMPIVHYWYLTWILVVLPICPRISWLVLTGSMVIYFEATQRLVETGAWAMPTWAPIAVYAPFILVWIVEGIHRRRMVAVSRPSN